MEIKLYDDQDFDGVNALWREAFPGSVPENQAQHVVPAKRAIQPELLFVAIEGETILGSVMAGYDGHRGWLYFVAVRQSDQRRGIGAALVRHAEQALLAIGCSKVNLQVRSSNEAVVNFYQHLGYDVEDRVSLGRRL